MDKKKSNEKSFMKINCCSKKKKKNKFSILSSTKPVKVLIVYFKLIILFYFEYKMFCLFTFSESLWKSFYLFLELVVSSPELFVFIFFIIFVKPQKNNTFFVNSNKQQICRSFEFNALLYNATTSSRSVYNNWHQDLYHENTLTQERRKKHKTLTWNGKKNV